MHLPLMKGQTAVYQVVIRLNTVLLNKQPQPVSADRLIKLNKLLSQISEKSERMLSSKLLDTHVFLIKSKWRPDFITETLNGNTKESDTTFLQDGEEVFVTQIKNDATFFSIGLNTLETWLKKNLT